MTGLDVRQLVADTGRELLKKGLVARTWGNISSKIDESHFAISPSGLGYEDMQAIDVPIYDMVNGSYEGSHKPSSEKKIHAAAYEIFKDVNFVVHTHQDYATALSLAGVKELKLSKEDESVLGKVELAEYGLPGTGKLKDNVAKAMNNGSKVILMVHHGALILGNDKDDAIYKAELLEKACMKCINDTLKNEKSYESKEIIAKEVFELYKNASLISDDNILYCSEMGGIPSLLDDIAQMIGSKLISVDNDKDKIIKALSKHKAILVKGAGCLINTDDEGDKRALEILTKKAALAYRYTRVLGIKTKLSYFDCLLMKAVYSMKYSKKREG